MAEYWTPDIGALHWYLDRLGGRITVFGVPLHYHFHYASRAGGNYDMRRLLDGTLMQQRSRDVVTFVENHDSQPLQALESVVEPWFKPLAYALILLRREGYPCVFQADYDGAEYEDYGKDGNKHRIVMPSHRWPHRQVPPRPEALRLGAAGRLPRPLEPGGLGAARRRPAPEGDGRADERRPGGLEVDGGRARRTPGSSTSRST